MGDQFGSAGTPDQTVSSGELLSRIGQHFCARLAGLAFDHGPVARPRQDGIRGKDAKSAPVGALSIEDQVVTFLANLFFLPTRRIRYFLVAGDIKTVKVDFSFN